MGLAAVAPGWAQSEQTEAIAAEQRLLGSDDEEARTRDLLPFTRALGASGTVNGSLADSATAAGVPRAAMLEALQALDAAAGSRAPQDGDAFYVRWEQTYSIDGHPTGVGRVLWLELRTESGATTALHRFRPRDGGEQFFLAGGEAATPPDVALPIENIAISSRFGFRADPLSAHGRAAMGPLPLPQGQHETAAIVAAAVARAHARTGARAGTAPATRSFAGFGPRLFMHEGVDFAVPQGTPIHAASDGVVSEARHNGGYGNYIRIEHADGVATAYGHLSRFAPGLKPGARVMRGELVGFSGNTGRSTGPHLHFEVLADGKPVDPLLHAAIAQLAGIDLEQFARQVTARERERDSEAAVAAQ
ncbi:MAG: M23 family metallopeptidase [Reyranella sp.]|nr:M23 family metallopeptidase [Reyranella sp.]